MTRRVHIDINSDVGESFGAYTLGFDEEVFPHITSANIACGFHAGDPQIMRKTVALAKRQGVEIGAHPGFRDLVGFGRRNLDATPEEVRDDVIYQIGALQAFAVSQGLKLQHVKTHGSLYNMAVANPTMNEVLSEAVARVDPEMILVVIASADRKPLLEMGKRYGIRVAFEAFADRAYQKDGSLVPRRLKGAVIEDQEVAAQRALKMATEGRVTAIDGTEIELKADTLCVHGDNPHAVQLVKRIREVLKAVDVDVTPMKHFVR